MPVKRTKELTDQYYNYLDNHTPEVAARQFRQVLHGYLIWQMEAGFVDDMRDEIWLVSDLIDIMEEADKNVLRPSNDRVRRYDYE